MNKLEVGKTYPLAAINGEYPRHSIEVISQNSVGNFTCKVRYSADDDVCSNDCTFRPNGVSVFFGDDCRVDWEKVNALAVNSTAVPGPCVAHAFCDDQMQTTAVDTDMMPVADEVNHPPHYTQGGIECIDAIRAALTPEEFRGYCKGNVLKYTWRERIKQQDIAMEKAQWYINQLLEASK
jgi:hypothetical protein